MSASNEWWEYHLTPAGWVKGSDDLDFGSHERPIPPDRVLTVRKHEHLSSMYSKMERWTDIVWQSEDEDQLQALKAKYGDFPS